MYGISQLIGYPPLFGVGLAVHLVVPPPLVALTRPSNHLTVYWDLRLQTPPSLPDGGGWVVSTGTTSR